MDTSEKVKKMFTSIDQYREFKGLQKKQLAAAADITPQYYSELLEGKKTPSIAIIFRLLDAIDLELKACLK